MKKNKKYIICSWLLLICFIAGQSMVFSHQHLKSANYSAVNKKLIKSTLKEKCDLCDAMHHNSMIITHQNVFAPVSTSAYTYKIIKHTFKPIALVLAAGRAPPVS